MKLAARLRGWRKTARTAWERWRYAFDANDLVASLRSVGIAEGDVVMVHSAMDRFGAFRGTTSELLDALKRAVGASGTLLMPTIPFTGTAVDFIRSGQVFDVRRTPSRVGLLTEMFRRSAGAVRSVHPTHPVAAWGRQALDLVEGHSRSNTPCGPDTPYGRLLGLDGKILLLGVSIDTFTFFHAIEAKLEDRMPYSPFTQEIFEAKSRDLDGHELVTRTRLFDPAISRRRNIGKLVPELKSSGAWRETRVGNLPIVAIPARGSLLAAEQLASRGVFCYE